MINVTDRANIAMRLVPLKLSFRHLFSTLCAGTGSCFDRLTEVQLDPIGFCFAHRS
jgi:hypothetical protein